MKLSFHPDAQDEFLKAIEYYESCSGGLGYDFALEVYGTVSNIVLYPQAWPKLFKELRRCQLRRFPYGVIYNVYENEIYILAVMHLHREPTYWKERIQ